MAFQVKLVTAKGNLIGYAEPLFLPVTGKLYWSKRPNPCYRKRRNHGRTIQTRRHRNLGYPQKHRRQSDNHPKLSFEWKSNNHHADQRDDSRGSTQMITLMLDVGTLTEATQYHVVLITTQNNAFIKSATND